jgi:hypothetical protein
MILEEQNTTKERIQNVSLLKSIVNDMLPNGYRATEFDEDWQTSINIQRKGFLGIWTSVAKAEFKDDDTQSGPIIITFEEESEYSKIKGYLNESQTQFVIKIGNDSYY